MCCKHNVDELTNIRKQHGAQSKRIQRSVNNIREMIILWLQSVYYALNCSEEFIMNLSEDLCLLKIGVF